MDRPAVGLEKKQKISKKTSVTHQRCALRSTSVFFEIFCFFSSPPQFLGFRTGFEMLKFQKKIRGTKKWSQKFF
jgi:hypothetical protein